MAGNLPDRRNVPLAPTHYTLFEGQPDFVICGSQYHGGVRVIASRTLTHVQMQAQMDYRPIDDWDASPTEAMLTGYRIELACGLRDCVIIDAPDYKAAMEELWKNWAGYERGPAAHVQIGAVTGESPQDTPERKMIAE